MKIEKSWEYIPSTDTQEEVEILVFTTEEFIQFMETQPTRYYSWSPDMPAYSEEFVRTFPADTEWSIALHPDYADLFAEWEN